MSPFGHGQAAGLKRFSGRVALAPGPVKDESGRPSRTGRGAAGRHRPRAWPYDLNVIQRAKLSGTVLEYYPLQHLAGAGVEDPSGLPMTVKVLLEGLVRLAEAGVTDESNI